MSVIINDFEIVPAAAAAPKTPAAPAAAPAAPAVVTPMAIGDVLVHLQRRLDRLRAH